MKILTTSPDSHGSIWLATAACKVMADEKSVGYAQLNECIHLGNIICQSERGFWDMTGFCEQLLFYGKHEWEDHSTAITHSSSINMPEKTQI